MKNQKKTAKHVKLSQSLTISFLKMTIIPLIFLVGVITFVASKTVITALQREVKINLSDTASMLLLTYDALYAGDFHMVENQEIYTFMKGEHVLSNQNDIIDAYKAETNQEITFFYQNTRVLTTIEDASGNRIVGTGAHSKIIYDVIEKNHDAFYTNIEINNKIYFVYYRPIYLSDGTIFGIIGVAEPRASVQASVWNVLAPIIIIAVCSMLLAVFVSRKYSTGILKILKKTESFLEQVAQGNLSAELDAKVSGRKDELGNIGKAAVVMETSIRELIEKDVLTGLYTRRYGTQKLEKLWEKERDRKIDFFIAIGDIDFFKKVNDTYGHGCGDKVLQKTAELMQKILPSNVSIIRWGGEEFLFIFENMTTENVMNIMQNAIEEIHKNEIYCDKKIIKVSMTVGIAQGNTKKTIDEVITEADGKLYEGKQSGRNIVVI